MKMYAKYAGEEQRGSQLVTLIQYRVFEHVPAGSIFTLNVGELIVEGIGILDDWGLLPSIPETYLSGQTVDGYTFAERKDLASAEIDYVTETVFANARIQVITAVYSPRVRATPFTPPAGFEHYESEGRKLYFEPDPYDVLVYAPVYNRNSYFGYSKLNWLTSWVWGGAVPGEYHFLYHIEEYLNVQTFAAQPWIASASSSGIWQGRNDFLLNPTTFHLPANVTYTIHYYPNGKVSEIWQLPVYVPPSAVLSPTPVPFTFYTRRRVGIGGKKKGVDGNASFRLTDFDDRIIYGQGAFTTEDYRPITTETGERIS